MVAITGTISAVAAVAGAGAAFMQASAADQAAQQQQKQQAAEREAIAEQKKKELAKRTDLINKQRRQMGLGQSGQKSPSYSISKTGTTGIKPSEVDEGGAFTEQVLG